MNPPPIISIVVPSLNQAQYLPETLQSLVDQEYPSLEVIIQDGGSTDGSIAIAQDFVRRYANVFKLYVEKDSGQADALNRGFARTSGEVLAFLNSDDTYLPRILHRVADEIDPDRGRHVIMGRCVFTGEGSHYAGIEHPSVYLSHFEHLAIWKRGINTVPQPSVFWHRMVWDRCDGFDVNEHHALDYDFFCRVGKYYTIHRVDQVFSTYRMHDASKSAQRSEAEVLELSIRVSRKHWGSWMRPLRWRCEVSYRLYNRRGHEQARHHARRAEEAFAKRLHRVALMEFLRTFAYSPRMARDRLLYAWFAARGVRLFQRVAVIDEGFTGRYADGWIGPLYREQIDLSRDVKRITVSAKHFPRPKHRKIEVRLSVNGTLVDSKKVDGKGAFQLTGDVEASAGSRVIIEIRTNSYYVPGQSEGGEDNRPLSVQLDEILISPGGSN